MMYGKECIAMLLAGGQGSRLGVLTRNIAKPAVSFGGKYRIIDFCLSNCVNSGIDTVGVLTQYKPFALNKYIGTGEAWDLDSPNGGASMLPPFATEKGGNWYEGTADAIFRNLDFIDSYNPEHLLILSGDHLYKMDYNEMLRIHKEAEAALTIAVYEVTWEEASRFGIMSLDDKGEICKFSEKPKNPDSNLASMGIYIFRWDVLRAALLEDHDNPESEHDFGKNIIPLLLGQGKKLIPYRFKGYWKDVGTIDSYYEANIDLLDKGLGTQLFLEGTPVFSNSNFYTAQYIGAEASVKNAIVSNGCSVIGDVNHSILGSGVYVDAKSTVSDSIILPEVKIGKNCVIKKAIINEGVSIKDGSVIADPNGEIMVIGADSEYAG
ncbi:MAG: glucose-1-phosphate adenylyltransferase [Parasporobacterium sp.]|nr:glucose-1-phosphate adenylyltransferase [Parasporobacterium sp.]